MLSPRRIHFYIFVGVILFALVGAGIVAYATVWGPWAYSDSAGYLAAARNLITGHGFGWYNPNGTFTPFSYYPAFYPLLLALTGWLGMNMVWGARLLDLLLAAIFIFASCWGAYRFLPRIWPAFALGIFLLCSAVLLEDFSSMMSEPVFLATGFSGLVFLLLYLEKPSWGRLIAAGVATALAMISRYIGFTFLITGLIGLLFLTNRPWKQRFLPAILYGVVACIPTLINQLWVYFQIGKVGNRNFALSLTLLARFKEYIQKAIPLLKSWIPYSSIFNRYLSPTLTLLLLACAGLLLLGFIWLRLHRRPEFQNLLRYTTLMILFCGVYALCLGISYIVSSPSPDIQNRMLSPLLPALLGGSIGLLVGLVESLPGSRWTQWLALVLILMGARTYEPNAVELLNNYHINGVGYTASDWHASGVLSALADLPANASIISNDPGLVLFYTNRFPYDLATDKAYKPGRTDLQPLGSGSDPLDAALKNGAAFVVIMPTWRQTFGNQSSQALSALTQGLKETYSNTVYNIYYYP